MPVEIYMPEAEQSIDDAERISIINMSGFAGQKKFIRETNQKVVNPFRVWSAVEKNVFEILYPTMKDADTFEEHILPLEVLQQVLFAKTIPDFANLQPQIHHSHSRKGEGILTLKKDWSDRWIIARWGTPLLSFEQLTERAIAIESETLRARAVEKMGLLKEIIADPIAAARGKILGNRTVTI